MNLWTSTPTLAALNALNKNNMIAHLGIEFTEIGADFLRARMPVDQRTLQPYGLLHGGASVTLAETLGSSASALCVDGGKAVVGIEINANHVRGAKSGWVIGTARALHIGRSTHVWDIRIENEEGKLVCVSRLTVAIIGKGG